MTRTDAPRAGADLHRLLDSQAWGATTPPLRMLGCTVRVACTDRALADHVAGLYAPMTTDERPEHLLSLAEPVPGRFLVHFDGVRRVATRSPAVAFARLVWEANRQAIEHTHDRVLLHAAAAAGADGRAAVIAGPMGAGKSTLVAALVGRGYAYVTDELVAIAPGTTTVDPYPKPISLGGFGLAIPEQLDPLRPAVAPELERYLGDRWLVAPRSTTVTSTPVAAVIVPRYEPGARPALEPLRPADALVALSEHAFNLATDGQRTLDTLAGVADAAACFRLVSSDPDDGAELVARALAA